MLPGWTIFAAAFAYLLLLFAVATYGDRKTRQPDAATRGRPLVYALSLAIYCTSWTYFGGVGLASTMGLEFFGIYIGPILMFTIGLPLIRRIVALAKSERLTSIADFVGARYGKNPVVAAIVALIALIGAVPYIALQLKAVSSSVKVVVDFYEYGFANSHSFIDLPLIVSLFLACFAAIFGTRHTDATEHQDGLILAISMESVVKLFAFAAVGIYVVYFMFDGLGDLWLRAAENPRVMLPRQFHVSVVEIRTAGELRTAGFLFPLYLLAINLFVLPVAIGGVIAFQGLGDADLYVLALPLAQGQPTLTLISFIGGFSAATAMVIVECVALSIMVSNDIVIPVVLRRNLIGRGEPQEDLTKTLLRIRRFAIFFVLLLGYAYYRFSTSGAGLASIGLLAFAAIAQVAPALLGGLLWRQANARGAIAGMVSGLVVWAYLLFLPSLGLSDNSGVAATILGFLFPGASVFSAEQGDPLVAASVLSLMVNVGAFVIGSLSRNTTNSERLQANIFIRTRPPLERAFRGSKTKVTVRDLKSTVATYLGEERTERSFHTYERQAGRWLAETAPGAVPDDTKDRRDRRRHQLAARPGERGAAVQSGHAADGARTDEPGHRRLRQFRQPDRLEPPVPRTARPARASRPGRLRAAGHGRPPRRRGPHRGRRAAFDPRRHHDARPAVSARAVGRPPHRRGSLQRHA